ncbi:CMP-N-acetylneuraminate-beta-1,4-galactoside alpha-2,3-sialyltransferase isoform 1 [Cricetulus griseus]|nr:CMP-N-acetylneuraminate-beta-1,4-galactoside alpha-2,3-sialyltransferase isoform 1 [Cricetulus griseus]
MAAPVQPAASWAPAGVPSAVPAIRAAATSPLRVRPGAAGSRPPTPLRFPSPSSKMDNEFTHAKLKVFFLWISLLILFLDSQNTAITGEKEQPPALASLPTALLDPTHTAYKILPSHLLRDLFCVFSVLPVKAQQTTLKEPKMGLLVFVRNLLLALCLFLVLGFLYYSAWKLHLLQWEDSNSLLLSLDSAGQTLGTEYDRLGFLLKLDSKLPAELATKYANFSEGACKPGYASALMTAIFPREKGPRVTAFHKWPELEERRGLRHRFSQWRQVYRTPGARASCRAHPKKQMPKCIRSTKFSKPAPMFLDDSFRKWARIREFVPPFGIKGQDNLIKAILSVTKEYRLTPALDSLHCRRCIIVGNGGVLANKSLGSRIDDYDIVVRLNSAPVKGFERDVGSKTTLRITYPEGAMQRPEQYERDSLFVLAGFKWQDFKWLKYIVYKERVSASDGFWKSVATRVPKEPPEIRILNPYFIQEAAFTLIGLPFNNGLMGRGNIPTLGSVAVTMALHGCDEVAVAGFGYDMNTPNAPLHYYETVRMAAIKESWTHNIQREKEFLRKLVKARVITDLSSGI